MKKTKTRQPQTAQDVIRQLLKGTGQGRKRKVAKPTGGNFLEGFTRGGVKLGNNFTFAEMQKVEADLSRYGIQPGRTSGTLPERVVGTWLVKHGYKYGGAGYNSNISGADWTFQQPLLGGRGSSGGGGVADFFMSPQLMQNDEGGIILPQGTYWHTKIDNAARDAALYYRYEAEGYKLLVMWDYQALNPGTLDYLMTDFLGNGYK